MLQIYRKSQKIPSISLFPIKVECRPASTDIVSQRVKKRDAEKLSRHLKNGQEWKRSLITKLMLAIRSEKTPQTRPFHPQSPWIAFSRAFCMKAASLVVKWHVSRIFFQYLFPFVKEDLARNVRDIWMQGKNRNIQFFFPILIDMQHDLISWFSAQYELNCRLYWCMLHHDTKLLRISLRHRNTLLKKSLISHDAILVIQNKFAAFGVNLYVFITSSWVTEFCVETLNKVPPIFLAPCCSKFYRWNWKSIGLCKAKNWRSHGRQWRVKTDQGYQKLKFERPMCDYATEFRKVAM